MAELTDSKKSIIGSLQPMLLEAREKNMMIRCHYDNLMFTPDELERQLNSGSFCWGRVNWELVEMKDYVASKAAPARKELADLKELFLKHGLLSLGSTACESFDAVINHLTIISDLT